MPHCPKPFFRAGRGLWYVQIGGKQFNLGADRASVFGTYHDLMKQRAGPTPIKTPGTSGHSCGVSLVIKALSASCAGPAVA